MKYMYDKATIRWISVSHPLPARKMHPPEFYHYAVMPICACAKRDPALYGAGPGDDTRARAALQDICTIIGVACTTGLLGMFAKW